MYVRVRVRVSASGAASSEAEGLISATASLSTATAVSASQLEASYDVATCPLYTSNGRFAVDREFEYIELVS